MERRFEESYALHNEKYAKRFGSAFLPPGQSTIKKIVIEDVPIMTQPDGTIVCIPRLPEMGVIAGVGLTGTGKTLFLGRCIDEIFYNWNDYVGIMNDSQEETYSWSESCDFGTFIFNLRRVGQNPMPLPMLYLFPKFSDFEPDEEILKDKNYVIISIPFEEVINNISKYLPDLGNSEKYVLGIKDELLGVENAEELFSLIDKIDTGTKGMAESKHKIESSFKMLINEGIIDFNKSSHKYLMALDRKKKEKYIGNPFTAVMKAECIPSFITIDLYNRKYKDSIFSYYIDTVFQEMQKEMKGKRVWLCFDELTRVVHTDPQYTSPETERALTNIASRGRNNGISLIYATQRYNEIPKSIRSQTKFAVIFRHKSKEETKMICDDFALPRMMKEQILTLKKMEAIAVTTEYFVCYKRDKCWKEQGPIKGIIIPPLHKNRFGHKEKEK